jgi:hypothetical protein
MANWFLHKRAIRVPGFRPLMDTDIRCWLIIQPLALVGSPGDRAQRIELSNALWLHGTLG